MGIAGMTMVTGVLGAVAQHEIRRLLSFHIVSQIGYLIMGLGLLTELALTGAIFFMVHVILAKSALFLAAGLIRRSGGSTELAELGGLVHRGPLLAIVFMIPALTMAGIPPLSGFWAKLALVWAGLETGAYIVVAAALVVSALTLFSMIKIWSEAFWKEHPDTVAANSDHIVSDERGWLRWLSAGLLVVLLLLIGFIPEPFMAVCREAAAQLLDPSQYIAAVLGGEP